MFWFLLFHCGKFCSYSLPLFMHKIFKHIRTYIRYILEKYISLSLPLYLSLCHLSVSISTIYAYVCYLAYPARLYSYLGIVAGNQKILYISLTGSFDFSRKTFWCDLFNLVIFMHQTILIDTKMG